MTSLKVATDTICAYTFGMDTGDWDLATSRFAEDVDVDYSAVGGPKGRMTKQELRTFLQQLLGKPELRVHTAVSQVLENPHKPSGFIAYYSVRHYKGAIGQAANFSIFGWYRYALHEERIQSLSIHVSAMEGDPAVLA